MAGLIAALFGGKNRNEDNPLPGIGGYAMPRGPYGEGGFPGSTPATTKTHPQTEEGQRERQYTASDVQQQWKTLPTRRKNGTPRQPYARNKKQADDTTVHYTPVLSAGVPGNENQRNTTYYGGHRAAPNGTNRYVYNGTNGGFESEATDRRIPYRIHARPDGYRGSAAVRGADLSGQRYTMAAKEQTSGLPNGSYGIARERGPQHMPVSFVRPGPWTANYRIEAPDTGSQAPDMVYQSPAASSSARARKATSKPRKSRANAVTTRTLPSSRGRTVKGVRRG